MPIRLDNCQACDATCVQCPGLQSWGGGGGNPREFDFVNLSLSGDFESTLVSWVENLTWSSAEKVLI